MQISRSKGLEVIDRFDDHVRTKLIGAFFQKNISNEEFTTQNLAKVTGLHEPLIAAILCGQSESLTCETLAILFEAMGKRPELVLHDL